MHAFSSDGIASWLSGFGEGGSAAGAAAALLVGFAVALLLRALTRRLVERFERAVRARRGMDEMVGSGQAAVIVSRAVFAIVMVVFVMAATELLGLPVITAWLSGVASYLPRLLVAALIIAVGLVAGRLLRGVVARAAVSAEVAHADRLGRMAQAALVLATMLVAVEQLGIQVTFVTTVLSIVIASLVGSAGLAFGLGGRLMVANILAGHYVRKLYGVGQVVRIDGVEGRIVRMLPTAVILHTGDEEVAVPAQDFARLRSTLVAREV
ncbi:MAG TPA: hypothetical protein VKB80_02635 [Kofleriaceae bacterium]|nr:hypothetical protein [Kofleriaceae bacterium]